MKLLTVDRAAGILNINLWTGYRMLQDRELSIGVDSLFPDG